MKNLTSYELARLITDCKLAQIKIDAQFFTIKFCYMAVFSDYRAYTLCIKTFNHSIEIPVKTIKSIEQNNNTITIKGKKNFLLTL